MGGKIKNYRRGKIEVQITTTSLSSSEEFAL